MTMSKEEFVGKLKDECKNGGAHDWLFMTRYANYDLYKCKKCGDSLSER